MHDRAECLACDGDREVASTPGSKHLAWCISCRGTGLGGLTCDCCDDPVDGLTLNDDALECVNVLVHRNCDTGHRFFETQPAPFRGENFWGTPEVWR